jgi:hypothetical protein
VTPRPEEGVGVVNRDVGEVAGMPAISMPVGRSLRAALVADSASILASTRASGIATIAYARTPAVRNQTSAHADATVTSLADLVLRLRAHPLPN